jgi:hypothetical protein
MCKVLADAPGPPDQPLVRVPNVGTRRMTGVRTQTTTREPERPREDSEWSTKSVEYEPMTCYSKLILWRLSI